MAGRRTSSQMFALAATPPAAVEVAGVGYRIVRVFKHDFFAATCMYEAAGEPRTASGLPSKVVVKFVRTRPFFGLPMAWAGRLLASREEAAYKLLAGVEGVPRWLGSLGPDAWAVEYVQSTPLDHFEAPPAGFFDRLRCLFDAVHARGMGYGDANKRSNILVAPDGRPVLVDYQLSVRRRDDLPWPLCAICRAVVRYVAGRDLYHIYKHKRRMSPQEMTDEETALSRSRDVLHTLHRKLTDPWRKARRWLLRRLHRSGSLASPTEHLEDHDQPEKATWRERQP